MAYYRQPPIIQNVPIRLPFPRPCFLTDRIEHASYVLTSCIHPFETVGRRLNELPLTLVPPLPKIRMNLRQMKEFKDNMFMQYTAVYWKRAIEKIRAERAEEGEVVERVYDGTTRPPLVSESAMESILDLIPLHCLGFYPNRKYLPSMELSLEGLSRSIFLARENAAFYVFLLRQVTLHYSWHPHETANHNLQPTLRSLHIFLESTAPELIRLFDLAIAFLKTQGEDPHKLNVLVLSRHAFVGFFERLKYVHFVLQMHRGYNTNVVHVVRDLSRFQNSLRSIPEWNATGNVV